VQSTALKASGVLARPGLAGLPGRTVRGQVRGVVAFQAASGVEAERLVANDPFLAEGLLERHWVKEWLTGVSPLAAAGVA
jgi:uncharacterized protein YciI